MQTITIDFIKNLNPCEDGLQNLIKFYPNFNGNLNDFILLDNIPSDDKIWLASRIMTKNQAFRFSILCAESVLHHFESIFPDDNKPRLLLEFMNNIKDFDEMTKLESDKMEVLKKDVYTAATNSTVYSVYAASAANAASAAYAAYAASAAYYAVYSASAAASAAYNVDAAKSEQEDLNLLFLQTVLMA